MGLETDWNTSVSLAPLQEGGGGEGGEEEERAEKKRKDTRREVAR